MESESCVVGEWKNFVFKMIEPNDEKSVLENLRQVFCKDEPVFAAIESLKSPEALHDFSKFAATILKKNEKDRLSFVALDKVTGKIAGVRVTYITRIDDPEEEPPKLNSLFADASLNVLSIGETINVYERYEIREYANLLFTSVNPEFRGQGLVTEIYRRSFALMRSRGIPLCKCCFTSPVTRKVGIKFGFTELDRKNFRDFKDRHGQPLMPHAKEGEVAVLMALKL